MSNYKMSGLAGVPTNFRSTADQFNSKNRDKFLEIEKP